MSNPRYGDVFEDGQGRTFVYGGPIDGWMQDHTAKPSGKPGNRQGRRGATIISPTPARASKFFRASALHGEPIPPREWRVPELVPNRTVTIFGGDGGTGKSLLALMLGTACATAGRWLGREVTPCTVVYLSAEDEKEELQRRLADICAAEGDDFRDLSDLILRSVAGEDALLATETPTGLVATDLFRDLEDTVAEQRAGLVVLDTSADLYPSNENDRAKVRQFIGLLKGLAIRNNCAVVLLSHPSLTGLSSGSGSSGSTAWNNSVRSRLYLERIKEGDHEPNPNRRRLTTMKSNYGPIGGEILLTWKQGIFTADVTATTSLDRMAAGAKAERVFLALLDEFNSQGRHVNHQGASTYAPKQFAGYPKNEGVTQRAFTAAMNKLLSDGKITIDHKGPPSRRVAYLRRA